MLIYHFLYVLLSLCQICKSQRVLYIIQRYYVFFHSLYLDYSFPPFYFFQTFPICPGWIHLILFLNEKQTII